MSFKELGLSQFGIPSFAKCRQVSVDDAWEADVAVLGVPFDQGTGFRSGTRHGPKHIRDWSVRYSSLSSTENPGIFDVRRQSRRACAKIVDCGDVEILPLVWEDNFGRITDAVKGILKHGAMPITLGGDHSIAFPVVRAFERQEPLTIVQFDAHTDYRDDVYGVRYGHGNALRRIRELPFVERIVAIGINSYRQQEGDLKAHREHGNEIIYAYQIHDHGVEHFLGRLPADRDVYITFDIDAFDASVAPGTGTPEPGGLNFVQVRRFLDAICSKNRIVGLDVVEVNPLYDPSFITALLANHVIVEVLAALY